MLKTIATGLLSALGWLCVAHGYWPAAVSCFCCAFVVQLVPSTRKERP